MEKLHQPGIQHPSRPLTGCPPQPSPSAQHVRPGGHEEAAAHELAAGQLPAPQQHWCVRRRGFGQRQQSVCRLTEPCSSLVPQRQPERCSPSSLVLPAPACAAARCQLKRPHPFLIAMVPPFAPLMLPQASGAARSAAGCSTCSTSSCSCWGGRWGARSCCSCSAGAAACTCSCCSCPAGATACVPSCCTCSACAAACACSCCSCSAGAAACARCAGYLSPLGVRVLLLVSSNLVFRIKTEGHKIKN